MDHGDGRDRLERVTRVVLRPIGSPLPLGFFAFGIGSALLSFQQFMIVPASDSRSLLILLAVFVFPLQLLSSIFAFLSREPLAATLLALLAFSWPANTLTTLLGGPGAESSPTVALFYFCISAVLLLLAVPALTAKPVLGAVAALAVARYALLGATTLTGAPLLARFSGGVGFAIFGLALYGGLALVCEDVAHRTVLPFPRFGEARRALETDLLDQAQTVAQEAGVRRQL